MSMRTLLGALLAVAMAACSSEEGPSAASSSGTASSSTSSSSGGGSSSSGGSSSGGGGPACGRLSTPCEAGDPCQGAPDCASGSCRDGVCQEVSPGDGVKNGDETDVDCGGSKAPACADGKGCAIAQDCVSGVCTGNVCQAPSPTDGVQNGDETGVDCGGSKAPKCPPGQGCLDDADCDQVRCDIAAKVCASASANDGIQNGTETDVDCGGGPPTNAPRCDTNQKCLVDTDCNNVACNPDSKRCNAPTASDGRKNGTETDVDCGGGPPTNAPRCADDRSCLVDSDCASGFCNTAGGINRCVAGRSCKTNATAGITTCGRGETNDPGRQHESCCRSLPLPSTPSVRLDKYEITAGRIRQFITAVGPNLRQWALQEIAANTPTGQRLAADLRGNGWDLVQFLPASANPGQPLNLLMQLGGTVMDARYPSVSQGCWVDDGAYGHNTYWWDHDTLKAHFGNGISARRFTQAQYDEKPINCAPYWIYAAFCAWDGGRMPTLAEIDQVWTQTYPWGSSWGTVAGGTLPIQPASGVNWSNTVNNLNNNLYFYYFPAPGNDLDTSGYIAAPGRFFRDATAAKSNGEAWQDLAANQMEMVKVDGDNSGTIFCDFNVFPGDTPDASRCNYNGQAGVVRATSMPRVPWVGGSWEVHAIRKPYDRFGAHVQYGKTGARCAR